MQNEKWFLRIGGDDGETFSFNTKDEMWKALEKLIELKETHGKLNKDDRGYNK
jgi:hypothetical protein